MSRYIIKRSRRTSKITVHILASAHHHPRIMQKRIILLTLHPRLLLRTAPPALTLRPLLYRMQLYRLLGLLYRTVKTAARLRSLLISLCLRRMSEQQSGVIVLILPFHLLQCLLIMLIPVEINIITSHKRLILPRSRRIFLSANTKYMAMTRHHGPRQPTHVYNVLSQSSGT